jgi:hypothetical protein
LAAVLLTAGIEIQPASGQEPTVWKVGVATVKITPQTPIPMAGYAGRKKPAEGVALDLFAKALAIEDPRGTRVVIVTMDLISVSRALRDWLEGQVQQKYGLGRSSLLINVSHTHCGPVVGRPMLSDTPVVSEKATPVERYIAQLQTKLVALVGDALGRLAPAKLDFLRGRAGFAMNRRRPTVQGYSNAPNYHGRTLALAVEAALQTVPRPLGGPLRVDLKIGQQATVKLVDGKPATVKLLKLEEQRDSLRHAIRQATVTVEVNGRQVTLNSATY